MLTYFNAIPLKLLRTLLVFGLCFYLSSCQYLALLQSQPQDKSSQVPAKTDAARESLLQIASAEYDIFLKNDRLTNHVSAAQHMYEQVAKVKTKLTLNPSSSNSSKYFQFRLKKLSIKPAIDQASTSCIEAKSQDTQFLLYRCLRNERNEYVIKLSYQVPINQVQGYQRVLEGERSYHLFHIPHNAVGEFLIGFNVQQAFPRVITVQGNKSLKLFGHPLLRETEYNQELIKFKKPKSQKTRSVADKKQSKTNQDKEPSSQMITRLTWSNTESDQAYPLFFGFGNWEAPTPFDLEIKLERTGGAIEQFKQSVELIAPLGSQHHQVGKQSLKALQIKTLQAHAQKLNPIWTKAKWSVIELQSAKKRPLLFIILPEHPGYKAPDLRSHGVIFIDESWFYRFEHFSYAMSEWDLLKVFKGLYISLQAKMTPDSNLQFIKAISWWRSLEHLSQIKTNQQVHSDKGLNHYQSYLINLSRELSVRASNFFGKTTKSTRLRQQIFGSTINMIYQWLNLKKMSRSKEQLRQLKVAMSHSVSKAHSSPVSFTEQITILGQQLNQLDSHLKQVLESYMNYGGLPLIYVKWTQKRRGDRYHIRFRVSQRPFLNKQEKNQSKLSIWVIPICLKLGIRDNPARPYCFLLDQPEASHYELSIEAPLEWVHPNYGQSGLYLWSLDQSDFLALLNAESGSLNLAEFLSLSEMSSALVEIGQGSPINYLKSVRELAKSQDQPLSLDTLFIHLNRVVHYFGNQDDQVGLVERWASSLLLGVMLSKTPKYPLDYLTQLQLAQWDRSEISMEQEFMAREPKRHKRELRMIKKFLRPTSSQEAIEEDVAQVKLEKIQYPLLMKALLGDQELWNRLHNKLAESEDEPLARLMIIQALVQFIDPNLFRKTLDLLKVSASEKELEISENQEATEDLEEAEEAEDPLLNELAEDEIKEDIITEDEKQENLVVSLRVEDSLELIKAIRSIRAKRLAWKWLLSHKGKLQDIIMYARRAEVQAAVLEWASALCDAKSSAQLKKVFKNSEFGFRKTLNKRAELIIQEVDRCVKMSSLKPNVEAWIQNSLDGE